jgi:hypothetical protein
MMVQKNALFMKKVKPVSQVSHMVGTVQMNGMSTLHCRHLVGQTPLLVRRPELLSQQIRNAKANARADDRLNNTERQIGNIQIGKYQTSHRQDQAAPNHEGTKHLQDEV